MVDYRKLKFLTAATGNEVWANIKALNLYPFGFFKEKTKNHPHPIHANNPRPILLVHGIVHNRSAFYAIKKYLKQNGWHNVYTINYNTTRGSLTSMVGQICQRVDEILNATQQKQMDIVAHSLGGLVAKYLMLVGEGRGRIKHLITLGTPHQGTSMSRILKYLPASALSSDLAPDSYILKTLNQTSLPRGSKITSIFTEYDWTVYPRENCRLPSDAQRGYENIQIKSIGHANLLFHPEVMRIISQQFSK